MTVVEQIHTRLSELTSVTVFYGDVPANPPADATGQVYPYAVLWGSTGSDDARAEDLSGAVDGAAVVDVLITVAAGTPDWCLKAAGLVRDHLSRWQPTGAERLRDDGQRPTMLRDDEVTPRRWFIPLQFRTAS